MQSLLLNVLPAGVWHFSGFLTEVQQALLVDVARDVVKGAPLVTPVDGYRSAHKFKTTSCGDWGWQSTPDGIRYARRHLESGQPFPPMPVEINQVIQQIVSEARISGFVPDSCQINFFRAREGRWPHHVDDRERDREAPVIIVGLGSTATISILAERENEELAEIEFESGDVLVMAGPGRSHRYGFVEIQPDTSDLVRDQGHISIIARRVA